MVLIPSLFAVACVIASALESVNGVGGSAARPSLANPVLACW